MSGRKLAKTTQPNSFFKKKNIRKKKNLDEGKIELRHLSPFVISGGEKTERWYFQHIRFLKYGDFIVKPEYFGKESRYFRNFLEIIKKILKKNSDAKIFCVYDKDTVNGGSEKNQQNDLNFLKDVQKYISENKVVLCPSMPCFEYWFYLHFDKNIHSFKDCKTVTGKLSHFMRSYFPNNKESLLDIIKSEKYLSKVDWVKKLCDDDKLKKAIQNAESNYKKIKSNDKEQIQSYSLVYKMFDPIKKEDTTVS